MKILLKSRFTGGIERRYKPGAFTRCELVIILALVALLLSVTLSGLAAGRNRSEQVHCFNNLRLTGNAFNIWSADHDGIYPFRVPTSEGGTMPDTGVKVGLAWYEFAWVSNELASARTLACPSDTEVPRAARDFSNSPEGGFLHFNYRNNALSYFIHMDAKTRNFAGGGTVLANELARQHLLAGDRNLRVDALGLGCSSRINNAARVTTWRSGSWGNTAWTNGIHQFGGNLLVSDGSVTETRQAQLEEIMSKADDNGSVHLLFPR